MVFFRSVTRFTLRAVLLLLVLIVVALACFRLAAHLRENKLAEEISPQNGRFVETSEGRVHVSIWGDENTDTVVLTHGMAAWGGLWTETAEFLASSGYRVIAFDQPPFGFSDRAGIKFNRSSQAIRLKALETSLDLNDYVLVGHSYGGGIALETALKYPEKLKQLILVCPVIGLVDAFQPSDFQAPWLVSQNWLVEPLVSATITNPWMTSYLTKTFLYRKESLTDIHVNILQRPMPVKGNTAYMAEWLGEFYVKDKDALSHKTSELASISVPVSLIWGEKDSVTPISQGENLARVFGLPELTRLDKVGHIPQVEVPEVFNQALLKILAR